MLRLVGSNLSYTKDSQPAIPINPITTPESAPVQDYQARHEQLIEPLRRFMGGQMRYVDIWLNSPHPDLGGLTPQFFIDAGKIEVVESLAWANEHCQPG